MLAHGIESLGPFISTHEQAICEVLKKQLILAPNASELTPALREQLVKYMRDVCQLAQQPPSSDKK